MESMVSAGLVFLFSYLILRELCFFCIPAHQREDHRRARSMVGLWGELLVPEHIAQQEVERNPYIYRAGAAIDREGKLRIVWGVRPLQIPYEHERLFASLSITLLWLL